MWTDGAYYLTLDAYLAALAEDGERWSDQPQQER